MASKAREIQGTLAPPPPLPEGFALVETEAVASDKWMRANAILMIGMKRRAARLEEEAANALANQIITQPKQRTPKPKS